MQYDGKNIKMNEKNKQQAKNANVNNSNIQTEEQKDKNLLSKISMPKGSIKKWTDEQLSYVKEQCQDVIKNGSVDIQQFNKKEAEVGIEPRIEDEYNKKNNAILDAIIKIITLGLIDKKDDFFEEKKDAYLKVIKNNLEKQNIDVQKNLNPVVLKLNEINDEMARRQHEMATVEKNNAEKKNRDKIILNTALEKIEQLKSSKFKEDITDFDIRNVLDNEELQQYRIYQESKAEEERKKIIKENNALDEQIKFEEKKAQINEKRKQLEKMQQSRMKDAGQKQIPTLSGKITPEESFEKRQFVNKKMEKSFLDRLGKDVFPQLSLINVNSANKGKTKGG